MVGCWAGGGPQPLLEKAADWKMQQLPDGTFTIWFTVTEAGGGTSFQEERGTWSHSGDRYVVITTQVGAEVLEADAAIRDEYEVLSIAQDSMTYRHTEDKAVYVATRVGRSSTCPGIAAAP